MAHGYLEGEIHESRKTKSNNIRSAEIRGICVQGMAGHRWVGQRHFRHAAGGTVIYSGGEKRGLFGVAIYVDSETEETLSRYYPVNELIMSFGLNGRQRNIPIVQVYAPTSQADEEEIAKFYSELQSTIDAIKNVLIIMVAFNAKLGKASTTTVLNICRPYGLGERNENVLYTWTTLSVGHRNQIDFILMKQKWRTSVQNAKTLPDADSGTDH